jgi:hypothetical protein
MGNSSPADFDLEPGSRCCSRSGSESDSDAVSDESDDAGAPAPAPAPASAPAPAPALAHHDVSSDNGDSFEIQLESLRSYVASLLIVHTQDGHTHSSTIRCIRVAVTDGFGKRWPLLLQHWQQVWKTKFETYEGIAEFSGLGKNFKPEAYDCCVNGCIVYQKVHMHKCFQCCALRLILPSYIHWFYLHFTLILPSNNVTFILPSLYDTILSSVLHRLHA